MQELIAEAIRSRILAAPLGFRDKVAGMVQTIENGAQNGLPSRYPAYFDGTTYEAFIPDARFTSLIYFEDGGSNVSVAQRLPEWVKQTSYVGRMRLVCWLNLSQYLGTREEAKAALIMLLSLPFGSLGELQKAAVKVVGLPPTEGRIFDRYSYKESYKQYLMHPYTAFALDLQTSYTLTAVC